MQAIRADFEAAASLFFRPPWGFLNLGQSSGYSASHIAQVQDSDGKVWCLRRWASDFDENRLRFIHRTLMHSRSHGFMGVPNLLHLADGDTLVQQNGRYFDVQEWMRGEPIDTSRRWGQSTPNAICRLSSAQLVTLSRVLAGFHQSTRMLQAQTSFEQASLQSHLETTTAEFPAQYRQLLDLAGSLTNHGDEAVIGTWLEILPRLITFANKLSSRYSEVAQAEITLCHGDLWGSHVYFSGTEFTGLIDFESISFSTTALDLAQLILHFNGWQEHETVLRAYQEIAPLMNDEIAILPAAAALDLLWEGLWLIKVLSQEGSNSIPSRICRHNLMMLLPSVYLILSRA